MKKQHPSWAGIVPCFESGRDYLDWIQHSSLWDGSVPPEYEDYFRRLGGAVLFKGYDGSIPEKKMCRALERSQRTGEMIDIVPDPEFLPGGARECQLDGWTYHVEFVSREEYFKRQQLEKDELRLLDFIHQAEWHFAKTMPLIPHWYCLLKEYEDKEEFQWFAQYIQEHSVPGEFYGKTYRYYYFGNYKYWIMDERPEDCDLINRDIVDGEAPIVFPRYSLIVSGSLERVMELFRQYHVPIQQSDFFSDKGYVFMIRSGSDNGQALVDALENSSDVTALRSMYGQGIKEYITFCKDSIIPVEIGFNL